ncbi:YggT family protein [Suicoccus acidiformans]|uniref:YggT family protein n=2 Tax=Suicoccus acidiformans TaxID=2036206 RepID=A0A347WNU6_9LACT|nr:YggT family protein [Suicoccus acidiformans]
MTLFTLYSWVLVIYAVMSWLPGARDSSFGQLIQRLARPYLNFFDQVIPSFGGISFSVIIGLMVLQLIQRGLVWFLTLFM